MLQLITKIIILYIGRGSLIKKFKKKIITKLSNNLFLIENKIIHCITYFNCSFNMTLGCVRFIVSFYIFNLKKNNLLK